MLGDTPKACPYCGMEPSAGRHANFAYCEHPCHAAPALPGAAPDPFDAALAALDVEPRHDAARMVTTYDILGLDAVRAAHRAEVERAVKAEREACAATHPDECRTPTKPFADYAAFLRAEIRRMVADGRNNDDDILALAEGAFGDGVAKTQAAIRARGVAKRTDGEPKS